MRRQKEDLKYGVRLSLFTDTQYVVDSNNTIRRRGEQCWTGGSIQEQLYILSTFFLHSFTNVPLLREERKTFAKTLLENTRRRCSSYLSHFRNVFVIAAFFGFWEGVFEKGTQLRWYLYETHTT
jgi:hypothetical protein